MKGDIKMSKTINIRESAAINDSINRNKTIRERLHSGPVKTKIIIKDHNTGEILGEVHNKILVPGSQITACNQFGLKQIINFPTYNTGLNLYNSYPEWEVEPKNMPITCLWCAGRDGAGSSPNEVYTVTNTDRIEIVNDILPFRYVPLDQDLNADDREIYYGRSINGTTQKVSYFFKTFDSQPQLHIEYLDGTEVTSDMWSVVTNQPVEIFIEMRLSVGRLDFREYFEEVLGWDKANINTVSLVTAWYDDFEEGDLTFKYYQDIIPFSKFNFRTEDLTDLTRAIDFNYQVFY